MPKYLSENNGYIPNALKSLADVKVAMETYECSITAMVDKLEAEAILSDAQLFVD